MAGLDDFLDAPVAPSADKFLDTRSAADDFLDAEPRNAALRTLDTLANASGKVTEAVKAGAEGAVTNFGPALVKKAVDFNKLGASAAGLAFPQYAPVIEAARAPLIDQPEAYVQKGQEALADQKEGQPYWKQLATDVGAGLGALPAAGLDVAAGKGIGLGAGLSGATAAKQALPLGMAFFGAGEGGAEGAAKGYLEGLAMHGAGEIGQGLSVVPRVGAQMGAQGVVGAGLNSADAFLDGRVPTTEETMHAGATGAAIGLPFGLAPGKMGVGREEPKVFASDRPKDPATAGFWSRVNGTLSAAPERRLTSDELEMEAQTSPALKAFVATHDALVNNGRLDLAGKLSITDLSRGDDAAPSMALNLSGLSPEDRNQVYALAAKNGLSNNVEGQQGRLVFTGEDAGFAPVVTPDRPTNLLDGSALPIPKPQPQAEGGASSLTDRIIQAESGGNPNATAGTSSARGLGQFVEGTRNAILQRYGVDAWSKDPAEQRRATELLIGENRDALRSALGREPSDGEIYMANFLGAGGAKPFLRAMADNPGDVAANHVSPAAAQTNKSIFYGKDGTPRTLAEVYGMMAGKVGEAGTSGQPAVRPELVALRQDMEQRAPIGTPTFEGTDAASINRRLDLLNPARDEQTRQLRTDILARDEEARLAEQRRLAESPFPVTMEDMDQAPRPALAADPVGAAPFEQRLGGPEPRMEPVRDVQPEPRPYIDSQVQAMADPRSTKRAVLVTPGSPFPAEIPQGTKAFLTRHGTVLTSDPELARRLPYDATDQQMGAAVLNWEGGRPATVKGGEVVRALDANGTPVGEVHVAREDIPKALAAMRGLSPVDKAVRVPLKKALADRERGMAQQAKQISTLEAGIDKLAKRLAVTREPQARAKFENERQALEFQLRDLRGETAPVLTPEEQARAQAVRQRPALPQGQGFDLVGKPQDYTRSENASLEPYAREALARGEVPSARDMAEFDAGGGRTEAEIVAEHQRRAMQDYDGKQNSALWKFLRGRLNAKSVSDQYGKAALEDLRSKAPRSIFAANGDGMPFDRLEQEARSQGHIAKDADLVDTLLGNVTNKEQAARDRVAGQGERQDFRPVEPTGPNPEAEGMRPLNSDGTPRAADEPYYRQSPGQPKYGKITPEAARESLSKTPYMSAEVLNSPADMPPGDLRDYVFRNGGSGVKGLYDPKSGRSYVFSGNHADMADLLVTARDELFHRGTFRWAEEMAAKHPEAGPAFKQLNRFMRDVTVAKRETINAWLEKNGYGDLKGTHYGANEWLTHAASREAPKWYDRYVAAAAKAFRSIGQALGYDFKVTDAEIRDWSRKVEGMIGQDVRLVGKNPRTLEQRTYQGSPTRGIERMSDEYLGTGEGGRSETNNDYSGAYGWGHYSAQKKGTADWYRKNLSGGPDNRYDAAFELISGGHEGDLIHESETREIPGQEIKDRLVDEENLESADSRGEHRAMSKMMEIIDQLDADKFSIDPKANYLRRILYEGKPLEDVIKERANKGQLYQLEVPDSDKLLDWDKPLSEQPENVKQGLVVALKELGYLRSKDKGGPGQMAGAFRALVNQYGGIDGKATGESIYRALAKIKGSAKAASQYLDSIGIPGHQYLDGSSRSQGEGSRNVVVYSDKNVDITGTFYRKAAKEPTFTEDGLPNETIREMILRKYWNRMNRLTKTVDLLEKRGGSPLPDEANPALRENLYQGRTEERLRQFEADHVKPLVESVKAAGVNLGDVEAALYAMHAKRRNMVISERTKGENAAGSGITDAQADEIMAGLRESGKLEKIYPIVRRVWNINKARLALLKSSGLESEETLKLWRETYGENYVPLKSGSEAKGDLLSAIMGTDKAQRPRTGRGYDIRGKESQHATGRHTEAGDILANILAQYETTVIRAEKNRVGQSFLRMALDHPDQKLWEVDKTPTKPVFNVKTGEVETKRDPRYKLADNVFSVKVDGQEHLITIKDDVLARAMKNLGAEKSDQLLRIASGVNRFYSLINTSLDPEFLVSNAIRDFQTANLNLTAEKKTDLAKQISKDALSGAPIKGIYRALRERESAATDEWSQWFDRYRKAGGKIGFFGLRTVENQAKRIEGMLAEANGDKWAATKAGGRAVLDYIGDLNGSVENALRLSAFRRSIEAGMSEEKAANLAKELTVNFNKRGEASSTLNALFLFANASIQGNARILKALTTSKRGAAMAGGIILGSAALAALNRSAGGKDTDGQDFYDKIDDSVKSRNLVLMKWWKGDGSYMTLPLPYGYNVLKVVGDQIEAMALGKQSPIGAAGKATAAFIDAFNPLGSAGTLIGAITPTIGRPIAEISTNTDFGGNPIKPEQSKFGPKKPESQLAWSTVSKPAKWIAEELNKLTGGNEFEPGRIDVSPEVLEHLWSTYTGGVARFLNRAVNLGMSAYDGTAPATKDIPFARRLMGEQSPYVTPKQFREASDVIQRKQAAYLAYRETDPEQAKGYRQDNLEELAMVPKLKDAEKALKPLVTKRNEIKAMDVSDAEKALLLKPVEDQMATIQKAFLRDYLERNASPQDVQKADKTFTLKQAQDERAQILADYHEAIQDGDTERADAIAAQARQQYNDKVRAQKLPAPLIRGSSLREIRHSIKHGPSKSARRVERYLNTFDDEDNEE